MKLQDNIILLSDSYKVTHWKQYPPKTQYVYSYFESRGGQFKQTLFFGLQYLLKRYLEGQVVSGDRIDEAQNFMYEHLGKGLFNSAGWWHIVTEHNGQLPLSIKAVPEGVLVPTHNVLMTVENTCPYCYWVTNYLETLLVQTWYPTTVATLSYNCKRIIRHYLEKTGDPDTVVFKLHDFGFRGVSSVESAMLGGAAHMVNFHGTDTMGGLYLLRKYYNEPMAGRSIPAAEHSTITAWGKEHEEDAMENMLDQYPEGLVAVVSDSFNIFNACEKIWGEYLKRKVMRRNGTVIIRPDSGDPAITVIKVLEILGEKFGYSKNEKGYKVLDPHVRVIQGDGVDISSMTDILEKMRVLGWSADNIAFGMGGGLLQKLNRDTQKFAFKCSAVNVNGEWRDVYKQPVTDPGKDSKRGRLKLVIGPQGYKTVRQEDPLGVDELVEVFRDGRLLVDHKFADIRKRAMGI